MIVRCLISRKLNIHNEEIVLKENNYGKPICLNDPNLHFNISHSSDMVVCAIASNTPVGIDIEKIQLADNAIIKQFFTHTEANYINSRKKEQQNEAFFRIWCAKESYLKALGKGLYQPLDSFSIIVRDKNIYLNNTGIEGPFLFQEYNISPHYMMIACGQSHKFAQVKFISLHRLIRHFIYQA